MTEEILPRYEILFSDLKNHLIGDYLTSREFKLIMSKNRFYDLWQATYEQVKKDRTYISFGYDHDRGDNINTLVKFLNSTNEVESINVLIIKSFINNKETEEDFSDVIEAMIVSGFSKSSVLEIEEAYEEHLAKKLPLKIIQQGIIAYEADDTKFNDRDVFIVHGHNEEIKEKVARTLEKLKLNPIILHEQGDAGLTVIEKFEKFSNVNFAIVLLTYDDYGNVKTIDDKNNRARQNVILELGYFIGKLGRSKVMPLYEKGVELPSDISGVLYTIIDDSENWKFRLVKELKIAGYTIDANDLLT